MTRGCHLKLGVLPGVQLTSEQEVHTIYLSSTKYRLSSTKNVTLVCPPVHYRVFVTVKAVFRSVTAERAPSPCRDTDVYFLGLSSSGSIFSSLVIGFWFSWHLALANVRLTVQQIEVAILLSSVCVGWRDRPLLQAVTCNSGPYISAIKTCATHWGLSFLFLLADLSDGG